MKDDLEEQLIMVKFKWLTPFELKESLTALLLYFYYIFVIFIIPVFVKPMHFSGYDNTQFIVITSNLGELKKFVIILCLNCTIKNPMWQQKLKSSLYHHKIPRFINPLLTLGDRRRQKIVSPLLPQWESIFIMVDINLV